MSLRARLLVALVVLAGVGLVVTNVVTTASLRSYLFKRVDQQLVTAQAQVEQQLRTIEPRLGGVPGRPRGPARILVPPGTYVELRDQSGEVIDASPADQKPLVPAETVRDVIATGQPKLVTVRAETGSGRYRVMIASRGSVYVVAVPLSDVNETLRRLLLLGGGVSVIVLAALGGLAWWAVKIGLRPLEKMEETAGAIAAGDLSRRIEDTDSKTEVGRLGIALNEMLVQIEGAFAQKAASEEKLRRFLADASHELRTPLTSIRGYAELFRRAADKRPDDLAKSMRRIEDEAGRMGVLVEDLLLLARLDEGRALEHTPVDLTRVAADAVDDARARDPERQVRLEAWPSITVLGDSTSLHQVTANLLGNAIEHTPAGTPIEVRVFTDNGFACLDVTDHGPGLTRDEATQVFERFYRSDPSRTRASGGAGLGLAIVAALAEAHGGNVAVSSTPGQGATFRVRLPVATPSWAAPPATPTAPADGPPTMADGDYLAP